MEQLEMYLILNSVLIGVLTILGGVVGFFLRDMHKEFKRLIEKVNELSGRLNTHVSLFDRMANLYEKRMDKQDDRIATLEDAT